MKKIVLLLIIVTISTGYVTNAQSGIISTSAGNGTAGYTGDGGPATAAELNTPMGIAIDNIGNIYIADAYNNRIRKVSASGTITTVAGNGIAGYGGDGGQATAAALNMPYGLAIDGSGNIYIADAQNNRIRKVNSSGIITTFAGTGTAGYSGNGSDAIAAELNQPYSIAIDVYGNVLFTDFGNNCVRKINTAGIITTFAGTNTFGYSGDGGQATLALLNSPVGLTVDEAGNVYVSDPGNNNIRVINTLNIITTFAGNGTAGYSGDGGAAVSAELNNPQGIIADALGNIYVADGGNNRIRKINNAGTINSIAGTGFAGFSGDGGMATAAELNAPMGIGLNPLNGICISDLGNNRIRSGIGNATSTIQSDSFSVYISNNCGVLYFEIVSTNYSVGKRIKTYFGNGLNLDTTISQYGAMGIINFYQTYSSSGFYTIKHVLYDGLIPVDSIIYSYDFKMCNTFAIQYYFDVNGNCTYNPDTDIIISAPFLTEVDSNGVVVDTISSSSGFYYKAYGNNGDIYSFKILTHPNGLVSTCPVSGLISDTLQSSIKNIMTHYIGFSCGISSTFDLRLSYYVPTHSQDEQWGWIYASNNGCNPLNATLTMDFSPNFDDESMVTAPYTVSGNSIIWNLSWITDSLPKRLFFKLNSSFMMTIGDTVQNHVKITPLDADTVNNYMIIIDTVRAGCDPNEMWVSPNGCIPHTSGVTQLKYTISFMNTGNDTAFNIYILDTLSNNVDLSSMRMVMTSAVMNISNYKDATGQNIVKFDFPGINLLDSMSHPSQCAATVIFTINTKQDLPDSTVINNEAGIYFDYNPVVMTNKVQNKVGCPTEIRTPLPGPSLSIFPNPVTTELTIKTANNEYTSFTITNMVGQQIIQQSIDTNEIKVNTAELPTGVYFITFIGEKGEVVRKFVKM